MEGGVPYPPEERRCWDAPTDVHRYLPALLGRNKGEPRAFLLVALRDGLPYVDWNSHRPLPRRARTAAGLELLTLLLLHPGAMGASIGAALTGNGHDVRWVSQGRSDATRERAHAAGLRAVAALDDAMTVEAAISVCPPHAAVELAEALGERGFAGTYVDGNAVSPATAARVASLFGERYVDGGIIGPPAWRANATRFYLSGPRAGAVADLFEGSLVDARAIGQEATTASALKMCYAAFTKGSSALLLGVRALAERNGVSDELLAEWDISQPGLAARSAATAKSTSPKAWRFEGEMREIAATFAEAGLPAEFHEGAAKIYERMAALKDTAGGADIDTVLRTLLN